jgi:hypothetical protein
MRHHNDMKVSVTKFAFSFYSAIASVSFLFYKYLGLQSENGEDVSFFIGLLLFISFSVGLYFIAFLIQNRKYFVDVARQVNSIRKTYLNYDLEGSFNNQLYVDTLKPKGFNPKSTYFLTITLISFINSLTIAFSVGFLFHDRGVLHNLWLSLLMFLFSLIGSIVFSIRKLTKKD